MQKHQVPKTYSVTKEWPRLELSENISIILSNHKIIQLFGQEILGINYVKFDEATEMKAK